MILLFAARPSRPRRTGGSIIRAVDDRSLHVRRGDPSYRPRSRIKTRRASRGRGTCRLAQRSVVRQPRGRPMGATRTRSARARRRGLRDETIRQRGVGATHPAHSWQPTTIIYSSTSLSDRTAAQPCAAQTIGARYFSRRFRATPFARQPPPVTHHRGHGQVSSCSGGRALRIDRLRRRAVSASCRTCRTARAPTDSPRLAQMTRRIPLHAL